jgi:hypothetical protein
MYSPHNRNKYRSKYRRSRKRQNKQLLLQRLLLYNNQNSLLNKEKKGLDLFLPKT